MTSTIPITERAGRIAATARLRILASPVLGAGLYWSVAALAAALAIYGLNEVLGERFQYGVPRLLAAPGLAYAAFSFLSTMWCARHRRAHRFAIPWATISLVAGIAFYPFLFSGQSFLITNFLSADWAYPLSQVQPPAKFVNPEPHDSSMLYFPLKHFLAETLRSQAAFPMWDFARSAGMPFVAATLSGVFYPLNLAFVALGTEAGWAWVGLTQLLVAGVGMFLLVERLTQSRFAGLYAALAFMLMPYLAGWSRGLVWNSTGVWLPLICYCLHEAILARSARYLAGAALALAMAVLGGWIQWVVYIYILVGMLVVQYAAVLVLAGRMRDALEASVIFAASAALSVALAAVHLGPFLEVTGLQPRAPVPWARIAGILPPYGSAANLAYLVPELFGSHLQGGLAQKWSLIEHQRYLGALCLPLVLLAFVRKETARIALFLVPPILFFLSVVNLGLAYKLLYFTVPGFDAIPTQQTRALFVVEFLLLVVAGLGAANFRWVAASRSALLPTLAIACGVMYGVLALAIWSDVLALQLPDALRVGGTTTAIKFALGFVASGLLVSLFSRQMRSSRAFVVGGQAAIVLACAAELTVEHHKLASFSRTLSAEVPPIVSEIKAAGGGRVFRTGGLVTTHAFIQNTAALLYGLNDTMAHDSIYLESYAKFFSLFNPRTDFRNPHQLLTPKAVTPENVELIRMLNVDYVFHKEDVTGTKVDPSSFDPSLVTYVRKDGGRHVLRLKERLPRAFFVRETRFAPEPEVMARIRAPEFRATAIAYVADSEATAGGAGAAEPAPGAIEYAQRGPNSFVVRYSAKSEQPIFVSNVYYPGWRAVTRTGTVLPIHKANLAFMVVRAPAAADGEIVFTYAPTNFRIFALISLLALLAALLLLTQPSWLIGRFESLRGRTAA